MLRPKMYTSKPNPPNPLSVYTFTHLLFAIGIFSKAIGKWEI